MKWVAIILISASCEASDWYSSPTAQANVGDGSLGSPWHLQTALTNSSVQAGDTIWLRGGIYHPTNTSSYLYNATGWVCGVSGAAGSLVTYCAYTNELPAIDGPWLMQDYLRFIGLEFYDSQKGIYPTNGVANGGKGPWVHFVTSGKLGCEWINCIIHDIHNGWGSSYSAETVRGCILWYVGWNEYEHVCYPNAYQFSGNICAWPANRTFNNSAGVTTGIYDGGTLCVSNIIFGAGKVLGEWDTDLVFGDYSDVVAHNQTYNYSQSLGALQAGVGAGTAITNNVFMAGRPALIGGTTPITFWSNTLYSLTGLSVYFSPASGTGWTVDYNNHYSSEAVSFAIDGVYSKTWADWQALGFDAHGTVHNTTVPSDIVTVIPNQDQPKRAHIAIYNFTGANNVTVNLSSILNSGDTYQLLSAQNYKAGPIQTGTFSGSTISVPMTNLTTAPILYGTNVNYAGETPTQPPPTSPEFGAFVLIGSPSGVPSFNRWLYQ